MGATLSQKVETFLGRLGGFHLDRAILFGSSATSDRIEDSDVDLILVSDDFEGVFFPDRTSLVHRHWPYVDSLDVLCYTRSEFEKKRRMLGIVQSAVAEGIDLPIPPGRG